MSVFQTFTIHRIFLILWSSLATDNFLMKRVLLRFRSSLYYIMHVFLSISAQFCFIKLVSFWVHFNARPNFVIVENFSCTFAFQYTTTNHSSGCIVIFRNFLKTYFSGPMKESCRCMISYLCPS